MISGSDSASPVSHEDARRTVGSVHGGLTKRELFAVMAMQGIYASRSQMNISDTSAVEIAQAAVIAADALIAELRG